MVVTSSSGVSMCYSASMATSCLVVLKRCSVTAGAMTVRTAVTHMISMTVGLGTFHEFVHIVRTVRIHRHSYFMSQWPYGKQLSSLEHGG